MAEVRLADWRDDREIFSLLMELRASGSVAQLLPYRPEKIIAQIEVGIRPDPATRTNPQDQRVGMIGVIGEPGQRIMGSCGLFFETPWWASLPMLVAQWVYVRQEARRGARLSHALFKWMIATRADLAARMKIEAEARGEPVETLLLETAHASGDRIEAKDRVWSKYGRRIGSVFLIGP